MHQPARPSTSVYTPLNLGRLCNPHMGPEQDVDTALAAVLHVLGVQTTWSARAEFRALDRSSAL